MRFHAVIPARFASTRLPGKPLADIAGQPMVLWVAGRARAAGAERVIVAADDARIVDCASAAGFEALLTSPAHGSGTERLAEVVERMGWEEDEIVVNVQGDEPLIPADLIRQAALGLVLQPAAAIATLAHALRSEEEFRNPNVVKVVTDAAGFALYFSRAPIPWPRDAFAAGDSLPDGMPVLRHIGLYAYRAGFLRAYAGLAAAPMEHFEMLEQLRALWHGYRIIVQEAATLPTPGVDTPEDLARVRLLLQSAR